MTTNNSRSSVTAAIWKDLPKGVVGRLTRNLKFQTAQNDSNFSIFTDRQCQSIAVQVAAGKHIPTNYLNHFSDSNASLTALRLALNMNLIAHPRQRDWISWSTLKRMEAVFNHLIVFGNEEVAYILLEDMRVNDPVIHSTLDYIDTYLDVDFGTTRPLEQINKLYAKKRREALETALSATGTKCSKPKLKI